MQDFLFKIISMTLVGIDICVKKWLDGCWIKTAKLSVNKDDFLFV